MSTTENHSALWVAYGAGGVAGTIRKRDGAYVVTMAGADEELGAYPSMEAAKGALHAHMAPGAEWPEFREH
ncbi:methyltransferase [Microbacterium sp. zg.Y1090]|uniref:methyltransferase n=1 Tax=Microbacterium TaxID=33882 RepID=UPI00214B934F|nr:MULTISPECIES: methyltransferase [unclassified Microbacterium]MCR2811677.1 methyltransferase [Microbacterium sp. zg.Y1084]MCR2818885.1 methyltransferase [Microbacterium sp. zg.Y1090]MDL5486976.1 methyltransferase [Microbacterium sp. zg-Y1211]WIM27197.1 methyltransferase [Microbacterium sp. zg-Y1090]